MYKFNFVQFLINNASNCPTLKTHKCPFSSEDVDIKELLHTFAASYTFSEASKDRNMLVFTNVNVQADDKGVTSRVNLK